MLYFIQMLVDLVDFFQCRQSSCLLLRCCCCCWWYSHCRFDLICLLAYVYLLKIYCLHNKQRSFCCGCCFCCCCHMQMPQWAGRGRGRGRCPSVINLAPKRRRTVYFGWWVCRKEFPVVGEWQTVSLETPPPGHLSIDFDLGRLLRVKPNTLTLL